MRHQGVFPGFLIVIVIEHATLKKRLPINLLAPTKGAIFSFSYFFKSFCLYYVPHNYVIPQAMPHAIPQTHSAFYPHRCGKALAIVNNFIEAYLFLPRRSAISLAQLFWSVDLMLCVIIYNSTGNPGSVIVQ